MSRFLPDTLYIGVEPSRITLVRVNGLWRSQIVSTESFSLPEAVPDSLGLSFLGSELRMPHWQRTRIHVTVADSLVRYFIALVPEGARNKYELQEAAALRHEEIFGDSAKEWTVVADLAPFTTHHLCCALNTAWLKGLRQCCRDAGLPLMSIVPFGVSEFNRHERRIGSRSGWVAVLGSDTLWLAFKAGTGWRSAQVYRRPGPGLPELGQWLAQQRLRTGIPEGTDYPLWLAGDTGGLPEVASPTGVVVRRCAAPTWPGTDEAWGRSFRLPLSRLWPACA